MTLTEQQPPAVRQWHAIVDASDTRARDELLEALLSDDVVFRSPAVHTPQEGRALTTAYLRAAMVVLGPTLRYERELVTGDSAVLEFHAEVGGRQVHGIDVLRWDASDRLVEFTVMARPVKGLEALIAAMAAQLSGGTAR